MDIMQVKTVCRMRETSRTMQRGDTGNGKKKKVTCQAPESRSKRNLVANSFWACPIYRTTGSEKIRFFTLLLKEKYCLGN